MCTAYMTAADMDRRTEDLIRADHLHQQADAGNIRDCVHIADFVEVDFLNRTVMSVAFRLSDQLIDCQHILPYLF